MTDSAGVQVIEFHWDDAPEMWAVDPDPEFKIGDGSVGPEDLTVSQVRSAVLLENGAVVLAHGSTEEVVWIDPETGEVRRWGGRGDGPEEFGGSGGPMGESGLIRVFRAGVGRIGAVDRARRAYVEIDVVEGFVARNELSEDLAGSILHASPGDDGGMYFAVSGTGPPEVREGVRRGPVDVVRLPAVSSSGLESITKTPGPEAVVGPDYMGVLLLGSSFAVAAGDEGVWVGDTGRREVRLWESSGGALRTVRWTADADREVTPERRDELMEMLAGHLAPEDQEVWEEMFETMPVAEQLPAFESLLTGPEGRLWIGSFVSGIADRLERPQPAQEWLVIDPATGSTGRTTTPAGLRVVQVGDDFILGIHRDDLGVETVRKHSLDYARALER